MTTRILAAVVAMGLSWGSGGAPRWAAALTPADFSYLGYYDIQTNGNDTTYMRSLTGPRMVNGQPRFLTLTHKGLLQEFTLPSAFGQRVTAVTASWQLPEHDHMGIWWEEAKQRLWMTSSVDYGSASTFYPTDIRIQTLGANGAVSNVKTISTLIQLQLSTCLVLATDNQTKTACQNAAK